MELSQQQTADADDMAKEEEAAFALVLEKSKQEAEMERKQEELLNMMKQIELDKPDNWGLKKVEVPVKDDDVMEALGHNMNKAIKKLELQQKIENIKKDEEDRKKLLQQQREELLETRNAERQQDLMRQTFKNMGNDQKWSQSKTDVMNQSTTSKFSVIQDNYEGFGNVKQEKSVLNDDFLGDLKLVDVPDSDDECYL